jgi:hypothetical protein
MPSQDLAVVLMNVSQGGACLALRQNVPLGRRVHVAFVIEGTPTYYAEGTVVWTAAYFHGLHLVGVRFDVPLQAGETIWLGGRA